ncbi:MAG: BREX-1 system phosphatase PglZ type A [Candidatus Riflebacteria bacterium HGW-Riflebacteria-2]|nr:MAG: BREX-1 system phosphatase PglZ type A [Candidatus Riflebacteria bacterium HGW-Riflebacteria-2]
MNPKIAQAVARLFTKHRIVFWYDIKRELRADYEALEMPDVEKIVINNNEYALKYRILREEPEQKFLLYREGAKPAELDNWLLDVELAHCEFRTDQIAIWLSELDLGMDFSDVVAAHGEFYQAARRKDALKRLLKSDDTIGVIRMKMLAVCAGSDARLDTVLESLLQELADGSNEKYKLICRCGLDTVLWEQVARHFDYESTAKNLKDFAIRVFADCFEIAVFPGRYWETRKKDREAKRPPSRMSQEIQVFFKRWKDSRQYESGFEKLSHECSEILNVESDLAGINFRDLIEPDYFSLIDRKIISDLVKTVAAGTVSSGDVAIWVRQRRQSHWYSEYRSLYEAIDYAAQFKQLLGETKLTIEGLEDGVTRYCQSWYKLDQLYRKFVYHVRTAGQISLLSELAEQIENLYSNNYLLKINDTWQSLINQAGKWNVPSVTSQKKFFERWVKPFLQKDNKVCVIISDAFRYEIGHELLSLIRQEDRYSAEISHALAMLPSYTQLGMAALLPNKNLSLAENDTGIVLVDGQSSQGTANRDKILCKAVSGGATAIKSEDLMALKGDDCRSLLRDHNVVYVYHNRIDATGDKRESEDRVFEAVEETLLELIKLIKKLTGANANNLLVTSDHGFIYQNRAIDESDFAGCEPEGDQILFRDRRFVLGMGLKEIAGLRKFLSSELDLSGNMEVQIPNSINRLRLKGSGSRYVHGGASLQEVIIPVLKINKKRQSDVSVVDVDILRGSSSIISSGQLAVVLYQSQPVTEKLQPRFLRAGIYTEDGELISESHDLIFDLTSDNPRERELQVRFVLSRKADSVNGQDVLLKLEEKHEDTTHYKEYKSLRYVMRRSFTTDFDF